MTALGRMTLEACTVVKIGGSVLRSTRDYRRCADALRRRLEREPATRLVVVVSARFSRTDRLARLAQALHAEPEARLRDLLWSLGETYSVAVLTLALTNLGLRAVGLGIHETGLRQEASGEITVDAARWPGWLAGHQVVVAPGFFALDPAERIASLGRGGSDFSAIALATALGAPSCVLVKDVGSYYSADPRTNSEAEAIRELSFAEALALAESGCPVVQREALLYAAARGVTLHICGLDDDQPGTIVHGAVPRARFVA